ncbi:MAG: phosphoribosyltransferase [Chitinispirillaceae bacterium]|nr:phosphoribosyltransferase [Chitinispirillaceae bacterium]
MNTKTFQEITARFRSINFSEPFDLIVAVANGGIIPAVLLNQRLNIEIQLIKINFRGADHQPLYDRPRLMEDIHFKVKGRTVLLVEDRIKTGATLNYAKKLLEEFGAREVRTFAVNGKADYSLFDEECFVFPWVA